MSFSRTTTCATTWRLTGNACLFAYDICLPICTPCDTYLE